MDAQAIMIISTAVVALTQLAKWGRLVDDSKGSWAVLAFAFLGVVLYGISNEAELTRHIVWPYFTGWVAVATSAAGVFGFTRALPESITSTSRPPAAAGQSPTAKT